MIEAHPYFHFLREKPSSSLRGSRHARTKLNAVAEIARVLGDRAPGSRLLDVGGGRGFQTLIWRDQLRNPELPVIYDGQDHRHPDVVPQTSFSPVELDGGRFPHEDETFDVAVMNQLLVTLKDIRRPIAESWRVLRPGGLFLLSVPNLAALHNRALLLFGFQPTTLHIGGEHVRGFACRSMTSFLRREGRFRVLEVRGIGLHPFTNAVVPAPVRTFSHTLLWVLKKTSGPGSGNNEANLSHPRTGQRRAG